MFEIVLVAAQAAPSAQVAEVSGTVTSFDQAFFKDSQPANALAMLQRLPGFTLDSGAGVRGFDGAAGNVLIDGLRPTSKGESIDEILRRIPVARVLRIDVIRGGAPGINMQGREQVANVVLAKEAAATLVVQGRARAVGDGRLLPGARIEASGGREGRKWELSGRYEETEFDGFGPGPQRRVGPNNVLLYQGDLDMAGAQKQMAATAAYEARLGKALARVNVRRMHEDTVGDDGLRIGGSAPRVERNLTDGERDETEIGGRINYPVADRLDAEVVGLWQTGDRDFSSRFSTTGVSNLFSQKRHTREAIARGSFTWRPSDRLTLEAALEAADNRLTSTTKILNNDIVVDLPAAHVEVMERRYQGLARAAWRWGDVQMEASLRREVSKLEAVTPQLGKTLAFTKPKLAASWAPAPGWIVRGRLELVVGQINFDDFVAVSRSGDGSASAGNPDIEPPRPLIREVTVEKSFWEGGALSLTLRSSTIKDVYDRAPVRTSSGAVFDAPGNIGDGRRDIAIFAVTVPLTRLGVSGGQLKIDGSTSRSKVIDPTTGRRRPITGVRPFDWSASFSQDLPRYNTTWGVTAFGDWQETYYRFSEIETQKLSALITPYAEWRQRPDLTWRLEAFNITNRPVRRSRTVFNGGRDLGTLAYVDSRSARGRASVMLTVRKTL